MNQIVFFSFLNAFIYFNLKEKAGNKKRKRKSKKSKNGKKSTKKSGSQRGSKQKSSGGKYKKETLFDVIMTSLQWESIEQMFFWDMICSHENVTNSFLLLFFNRLDASKHAEAMGYLYDILKCSEPSFELVKMIVKRRCEDNLARSLLINWSRDSSTCDRMALLFVRLLKAGLSSAASASACSSANQSASQQSGLKSSMTMKKIKYNESLSSNNKVRYT